MKRLCGCRTMPAHWDGGKEDEHEDAAAGVANVAKRYTALRVVDTDVADEVARRVFAVSTPLPSRPVSTMRDASANDIVEPEGSMERPLNKEGEGGELTRGAAIEPTDTQMEMETETDELLYLTRSISLPESSSEPSQVSSGGAKRGAGVDVKVEVEVKVEAEDCAADGGAAKAGAPPEARAVKGSDEHTETCTSNETKLRMCAFALAEVSAWCQRRLAVPTVSISWVLSRNPISHDQHTLLRHHAVQRLRFNNLQALMGDPKSIGRKHERRDIEPGRHRVQTASVERTDLVRRPALLGERARSLSPDTTGALSTFANLFTGCVWTHDETSVPLRPTARDGFRKGGAQSRTHGHGSDAREAAAAQRESAAVAGPVAAFERTTVRRERREWYTQGSGRSTSRPPPKTLCRVPTT